MFALRSGDLPLSLAPDRPVALWLHAMGDPGARSANEDLHSLVRGIRVGDTAAFDALYLALYPRALRVARRYVPAAVPAEDVVQEAFLSLWERRESLVESESVEQYLLTVIRHRAYDLLRHEQHVARAESMSYSSSGIAPPAMGEQEESAEALLERTDARAALRNAIDALPELQRRIITFRWRTRMSYEAIAAELGITVKMVRLNLERAHQSLRPLLRHLTD